VLTVDGLLTMLSVKAVRYKDVRWTTKQSLLSAIVLAQRFSLFGYIVQMPDETDAKKTLTPSPWRNGGDHQDALVLRG